MLELDKLSLEPGMYSLERYTLSLEPWRSTLEQEKLSLEPWRLDLEHLDALTEKRCEHTGGQNMTVG